MRSEWPKTNLPKSDNLRRSLRVFNLIVFQSPWYGNKTFEIGKYRTFSSPAGGMEFIPEPNHLSSLSSPSEDRPGKTNKSSHTSRLPERQKPLIIFFPKRYSFPFVVFVPSKRGDPTNQPTWVGPFSTVLPQLPQGSPLFPLYYSFSSFSGNSQVI